MSKRALIATLIICGTVVLAVLCLLFVGFNGSYIGLDQGQENPAVNVILDETVEGPIDIVEIDWLAGDLQILPAADGVTAARVVEYCSDGKMQPSIQVGQGQNRLEVKVKKRWGLFNFDGLFHRERRALTVYLPAQQYQRLALDATSGSYKVTGVNALRMELEHTSGDMELVDVQSDYLSIEMTSGNLNGTAVTAGRLDLDVTSGRTDLTGAFEALLLESTSGKCRLGSSVLPQQLDVESTSGRVEISLPENSGFTVAVDKTSGTFRCDFPTTQQDQRYVYGIGGPNYNVEMTSGTVAILQMSVQ